MKTFIWNSETDVFVANASDIYAARTLLLNFTIKDYKKRVVKYRENVTNGSFNPGSDVDFEEHFLKDMINEQQIFMSTDADEIIEEGKAVIFEHINFNE